MGPIRQLESDTEMAVASYPIRNHVVAGIKMCIVKRSRLVTGERQRGCSDAFSSSAKRAYACHADGVCSLSGRHPSAASADEDLQRRLLGPSGLFHHFYRAPRIRHQRNMAGI